LRAVQLGGDVCLSWNPAPGSSATRIHGADAPIRDIFDLRAAVPLGQTTSANATVPPYDFYAVTAEFDAFHNPALSPARNALAAPTWRPDLDGDGAVDLRDLATLVNDMGNAGPASLVTLMETATPTSPISPSCSATTGRLIADDASVVKSYVSIIRRPLYSKR
jgi:hypothetical protein